MLMCYDQIILLVLIKAKYTSILLVKCKIIFLFVSPNSRIQTFWWTKHMSKPVNEKLNFKGKQQAYLRLTSFFMNFQAILEHVLWVISSTSKYWLNICPVLYFTQFINVQDVLYMFIPLFKLVCLFLFKRFIQDTSMITRYLRRYTRKNISFTSLFLNLMVLI